jgi:hypothetical protein
MVLSISVVVAAVLLERLLAVPTNHAFKAFSHGRFLANSMRLNVGKTS